MSYVFSLCFASIAVANFRAISGGGGGGGGGGKGATMFLNPPPSTSYTYLRQKQI